jgi:hypothetical protein
MLKEAHVRAAMKEAQVYKWHKRFRDGRSSVNNDSLLATVNFYE